MFATISPFAFVWLAAELLHSLAASHALALRKLNSLSTEASTRLMIVFICLSVF
jgi:hypothetical protein